MGFHLDDDPDEDDEDEDDPDEDDDSDDGEDEDGDDDVDTWQVRPAWRFPLNISDKLTSRNDLLD